MRSVERDGAPVEPGFVASIDTCVGCLGCETACPSAVPYHRLLQGTRTALARPGGAGRPPLAVRLGLRALPRPRLVRSGALAVALAQRAGLGPVLRRRHVPRLPVRRAPLHSTGADVVLVGGCVMDAVQRSVHVAAVEVLTASGLGVRVVSGGCCGALADHAGLAGLADRQAGELLARIPDGVPVLVDSAGCGASLRSRHPRVRDVSEFLAGRMEDLPPPAPGPAPVIAVQDPCHLRHAQGVHRSVRTLLAPYVEVRELDDEGLCCGAGGSYSLLHPQDAAAIRDRKVAAVQRSGAALVASANPGCALHLRAGGLDVRHPVEIVASRLGRSRGR
jgi:glycolate oxidase iron-sulfur subunit